MKRRAWKLVFVLCLLFAIPLIASAQTYKTVLAFNDVDGEHPFAPLIQGLDGKLYGTTAGEEPATTAQYSKSRGRAR
jgi:hypothetical protein